ncbi:hypothetical protein SPRG_21169 [Saprolegnia parasitica CBS 223.65]|uniref:Uncharacterized protein n=1 Tax=Saprolegnia parasitica (strain CBS 223.65) TaxID=695850 RepID=A0A067C5I0_SAPPC|nr:hypothetical protein SPRG_21169 [Saprolegnia parasitica CBS 223.65]KDO21796.1 hypothetical protein SPRG_21169 [Saprolegnia parasitica CBS 223.65]|eukprot:XP_012207509.1 hypothetical protein SPRG_21169 [Saprolegnia parasitica CBS 223.65]
MAASTAQLHAAVLSHSVHLPKRVSQLWSHVAYDTQPSALSKAPLDLDAALRTAVSRNSLDTLRLLLDYGANLHATDDDAHSILYLATSAGHAAMTAELLLRGARATPEMLEIAIGRHHTSVVKLLLPHVAPTLVHVHDAIDANAPAALLQALVATMDDVDAMMDNLSPLMRAAHKGHAHLCDVLLDANADVFAENADGDTALHFACRAGHMHATYVLLQAGADMDMPNASAMCPGPSKEPDVSFKWHSYLCRAFEPGEK